MRPDTHFCTTHHVIEASGPDTYIVCGTCGHVWDKVGLVDAWNSSLDNRSRYETDMRVVKLSAAWRIPRCPECGGDI